MKNLRAMTLKELTGLVKGLGEKPYRAVQIYKWLWQKGIDDIEAFSDLPKHFRNELSQYFEAKGLIEKDRLYSADGSVKFIFELVDGLEIESVFIPDRNRKTVCVSTQVGCPIGCEICATGKLLNYRRNLKFWEIAEQVLRIGKALGVRVSNVVYMGMGEPFLNYDEVIKSVELLNSDHTLKIGARKITLSTVGIIPKIYELAEYPKKVKLAISLHTAIQSKREKIIPIARRFPLNELRESIGFYYERKRRFITFEYVLIPGFNDTDEDIEALRKFIGKLPSKINIIPFNPFPGSQFRAPTDKEIHRFYQKMMVLPYTVTLRKSKGRDVKAACGQLALLRQNREAMTKLKIGT